MIINAHTDYRALSSSSSSGRLRGDALVRIKPICLECVSSECSHVKRPPRRLQRGDVMLLRELVKGIEKQSFPSNKDLANLLGITEGTVKQYISRLLRKMFLNNRLSLGLWAQAHKEILWEKR